MTRRYQLVFEWGDEDPGTFEQQEYKCDRYSLTKDANLLTMTNVILDDGSGFHEVGIPLYSVRRYLIKDRHAMVVRP